MKGIAPLLIIILGLAAAGSSLVITSVMKPQANQTIAENSSGPVEIGTNAAKHFPLQDAWDYFFSGLTGIIRWLSHYIILPIINFSASFLTGHNIVLPEILGYVIVGLMLFVIFLKKWHAIWEFIETKAYLALIIIGAIVALIVALGAMGLLH